jgi:tetratricopeptide (TPR) repeat protein
MHCLSCGAQLPVSRNYQKCDYCGGVTQLSLQSNISSISFADKAIIRNNSEKFSDDLNAIISLAILYLEDELNDSALSLLKKGIENYPTDPELHILLAVTIVSKGRIRKSTISEIEQSIRHLLFAVKIDKEFCGAECRFIAELINDNYFNRNSIKPFRIFIDLQTEVASCRGPRALNLNFPSLQHA